MDSGDQSWPSTPEKFAGDWYLESPTKFTLTPGASGDQMKVTAESARGLENATFDGSLRDISVEIAFRFAAGGQSGGDKILTYTPAVENASSIRCTSPLGNAPNDWQDSLEGFEGIWTLAGGGTFNLRQTSATTAVLQTQSVPGLRDGYLLAHFHSHPKAMLVVLFSLTNNGNISLTGAKEILYHYPDPLPSFFSKGFDPNQDPTQGERFVEAEGGG